MTYKSVDFKSIIIVIFLMIFLMPGTAFSSQAEISQDIYIFPIPEESLDPHITWEQGRNQIFNYLYDSLYNYDKDNDQYKPDLASDIIKVERVGDLYKNIIPINTDKKFADGSYLTPEDVEYSILRLLLLGQHGSGSPYFWRTIFNQPDLSSFTKAVVGYSNPEYLSYKDARRIFDIIKERIFIEDGSLIIKSKEPIDFMLLLSDKVPWSSILNKDYMIANNGWDGNSDTWQSYYQRSPESSPLYDNNLATSTKWRVAKWRPGNHLTLVASAFNKSWYQKIDSLKLFFTSEVISSHAGPLINSTIYKAIFLSEIFFEIDDGLLNKNYKIETVSAESIIYLLKSLQENRTDNDSIIYYKNNENHKKLIKELVLKQEYSRDVVEVLNWNEYYKRLLQGDYKYAIVERLEPFANELEYLYTIKAEFDYPLELKEILDEPERILLKRKQI
ncbi:MAG: hypothetical protein ABR596_06320 [Halarsenatibacteraceae bacterium]